MKVERKGSVRVDLLGGTLDLWPINLILPHVKTLNVATSLKAKVIIEEGDSEGIEIISLDYQTKHHFSHGDFHEENFCSSFFGPLNFICQIISLFSLRENLRLTLSSGAPAGSGLGGSSAMGVTLFSALCEYTKKKLDYSEAILRVQSLEAKILNGGPAGYQDYYPALYGGILCLHSQSAGIEVEQLYNKELAEFLQSRITLIFSGERRHSGINNWEVYKGFFDGVSSIRKGLREIASVTNRGYLALKERNYEGLTRAISDEGEIRSQLFPKILSPSMAELRKDLKGDLPSIGVNVCGAGGGGCFMLIHGVGEREVILRHLDSGLDSKEKKRSQMEVLPFKIESECEGLSKGA